MRIPDSRRTGFALRASAAIACLFLSVVLSTPARGRGAARGAGKDCPYQTWRRKLEDPSSEEAKKAVEAMASPPSSCIRPMLRRLKSVPPGSRVHDGIRQVLGRAKVPVPSYSGWFRVPQLKPGEVPAFRQVDTLKKVLAMRVPRDKDRRRWYRMTMELTAVVRGLGSQRSVEVLEPLVRFAFVSPGIALRSEVSRAIETLGGYAVPGLLKLSRLPARDWKTDRQRYLLRKFAGYMLNVIEEGDPKIALAGADVSLRATLLETYGKYRPAEAVRAILMYTDHDDPLVRKLAKKTLLRYFEGTAPRAVRRHWKLPGGVETPERRLVYMTYRQRATHEIRLELERLTSGRYDRSIPGAQLVLLLFAEQDRRRARLQQDLFKRAAALWEDGKRAAGFEQLNRLLAGHPDTALASAVAPYFHRQAVASAMAGRLDEAATHLIVASVLHGTPSARAWALAEAAYVAGLHAEARRDKKEALSFHRRALVSRPDHPGSLKAVESLEGPSLETAHAVLLSAIAAAAGAFLLWLLGWAIARRRRPTPETNKD